MRVLVVSIFLVILSGCTKTPEPICKTVFKTSAAAANIIAAALQCESPAAITADISEQITSLGLCAEIKQQSMSDLVCPSVSNFISATASASIPKEWKCPETTISDLIKTKIYNTCVKIIK